MALVPLKLTPIDIAFVMILEQHFPRSKGLAVAVTFACPAIDNLGSLLAFTIDIDPSVEGVLQDRNNASIANRHPVEGRSEEQTSELQSLMRISNALSRLNKKNI